MAATERASIWKSLSLRTLGKQSFPYVVATCLKLPALLLYLCRICVCRAGAVIPRGPAAASSLPHALAQGQIEVRLSRRCAAAEDSAASSARPEPSEGPFPLRDERGRAAHGRKEDVAPVAGFNMSNIR